MTYLHRGTAKHPRKDMHSLRYTFKNTIIVVQFSFLWNFGGFLCKELKKIVSIAMHLH